MVWVWLGILIVMLVLEAATPTALVTIWFAAGALVAMILAIIGLEWWIQLIAFVVVSVILLLVLRPIASRLIKPKKQATNYDALIGKTCEVTQDILPEKWGHVNVKGVDWSARSEDDSIVPAGAKVEILAVEGAKLVVKSISESEVN